MTREQRFTWSLLLLRISIFVVMLFWTLDKFVQPEHSSQVFEGFYGIGGLDSSVFYLIGALELLLILAFVTGSWKRISYGLVLLLHGVSTLSSYKQYLAPFNNLLFFAAWPMLAACLALYWLRDLDTRWTTSLGRKHSDSKSRSNHGLRNSAGLLRPSAAKLRRFKNHRLLRRFANARVA